MVFKSQQTSVGLEGQRVIEQRGKNEERAYDELMQINWLNEAKPILYFLL